MRQVYLERLSEVVIHEYNAEFLSYKNLIRDLNYALNSYSRGRVLDIGCGNKPYQRFLPQTVTEYVGCDIVQSSKECVDILCSATDIPIADCSFDTILSTQTIEHVEDHQGLVNEAYRLLNNGGNFIVSGPLYWPLHEEPYDFFRFTKHGFRYILENAGFKVVEEKSNGGKWALAGQALIHALLPELNKYSSMKWRLTRRAFNLFGGIKSLNRIFSRLDDKFYDESNTMNYVIIAQKQL